MASTKVQLKLSFLDSSGEKISTTYNNIDPEVSSANVNALMTALVTYGEIFDRTPVTKESAQVIVTETNPITITPNENQG